METRSLVRVPDSSDTDFSAIASTSLNRSFVDAYPGATRDMPVPFITMYFIDRIASPITSRYGRSITRRDRKTSVTRIYFQFRHGDLGNMREQVCASVSARARAREPSASLERGQSQKAFGPPEGVHIFHGRIPSLKHEPHNIYRAVVSRLYLSTFHVLAQLWERWERWERRIENRKEVKKKRCEGEAKISNERKTRNGGCSRFSCSRVFRYASDQTSCRDTCRGTFLPVPFDSLPSFEEVDRPPPLSLSFLRIFRIGIPPSRGSTKTEGKNDKDKR